MKILPLFVDITLNTMLNRAYSFRNIYWRKEIMSILAKTFGGLAIAGVLGAGIAIMGAERQSATEVGIKTTGWGKDVSVSTESGLKLDSWLPGTKYFFMSTGEYEIAVNARLPDSGNTATSISYSDSSAQGVVKTKEGLPLEGSAKILLQFKDFNAENADQVETLYRKIPPLDGEGTDEYIERIMTRLAQYALETVQEVYKQVPVQDVTNTSSQIAENIEGAVEQTYGEQGLDFVGVNKVILAGINLGPSAETANQQIGLAEVQKTVAIKQQEAAEELGNAQDALKGVTSQLLEEFTNKGASPEVLDNLLCLHQKTYSQEFSIRHPQGCFGMSDLEAAPRP